MKHERELLALPVPPCPPLEQKAAVDVDRYKHIEFQRFHAEAVSIDGDDTLTVTTFAKEGKAEYRFFQQGDRCGMQVFEKENYTYGKNREPGKLYSASIDTTCPGVLGSWWGGTELQMYSTSESCEAVYHFLGKTEADGNPITLLAKKQRDIRKKKIDERDERGREKLRKAFEGVDKAIPKEFEAFCEEVPAKSFRYFFYEYTGKKEQPGICSHCMKIASLPGIKEYQTGVCPNCGTEFSYYSIKRLSRSHGLVYRGRAAFLCPVNEDRIAIRCCQVGMSLRGGINWRIDKQVWAYEEKRGFLSGEGKLLERYCNPIGTTTKVYVDNLCHDSSCDYGPSYFIAPMHLLEIRQHMGIYAPLEVLAEHGMDVYAFTLFDAPKKNAKIEYLIKMGLYKLACNEFTKGESILRKGKKAHEVLGVSPDFVPLLKEADPSARAFKTIHALHADGIKLTVGDMKDIERLKIGCYYESRLVEMALSSSIHKALKYISQQAHAFNGDGDHVCQEWADYYAIAKTLGMNMSDHCVFFPKNLQAAHQEASKIWDTRKDEVIGKQMARTAKKLEDLRWQFNGLSIRPAVSQQELFDEGKSLSHCVGRAGYAEKQAKGRTAIFFIRKVQTPDISFVTLELDLSRWEKIQCYGTHDTHPGKQVDNFVARWINEIVKPSRMGAADRVRIAV